MKGILERVYDNVEDVSFREQLVGIDHKELEGLEKVGALVGGTNTVFAIGTAWFIESGGTNFITAYEDSPAAVKIGEKVVEAGLTGQVAAVTVISTTLAVEGASIWYKARKRRKQLEAALNNVE